MKKQLLVSLATVILLQSVCTHTAESGSQKSWTLKGWLAAGACALGLGTYCYYKMSPKKIKTKSVDTPIGQIPYALQEVKDSSEDSTPERISPAASSPATPAFQADFSEQAVRKADETFMDQLFPSQPFMDHQPSFVADQFSQDDIDLALAISNSLQNENNVRQNEHKIRDMRIDLAIKELEVQKKSKEFEALEKAQSQSASAAASVEPIEVIALEAQRELLPVELSPEQMRDIRAAKLQEAIDNKKNVSTAAVNPVVNAPVSKPVVAKKPRSEQPDRSKFLNRFPGF